jgi:putative FmdB family regulatory protein
MPTYDYQCDACDHKFEEFQSFSEPVLTKCPACGKKKLRRLFGTGAGIIFKGSGFYETDYRSDSYKQAAKADQEKAPDKAGDAKTDGKASSGDGKGSSGDGKASVKDTNGASGTKEPSGGNKGPAKGKSTGKSSKSGS